MITRQNSMQVGEVPVEVVRKNIKHLHISVHPPDGRVRVSVPRHVRDEIVRTAIISRLGWIQRKQKEFMNQVRQSQRELVTGESHYLFGKRYRLDVVDRGRVTGVSIHNSGRLELAVPDRSSRVKREEILNRWYRNLLKEKIPGLIDKWEPKVGAEVAEWGVKRMKTLWGSCNPKARRIWINLELAKKPVACLEYIIVHEMVHFHERHHNERFREIMDTVMPEWRSVRHELNQAPLAHEHWEY